MQPLVVLLILGSALMHALWNAALKRQRDPEAASVVILGVALAVGAAAVPFAGGPSFPGGRGLGWALLAGVCEGGYFTTLALSLREAPLGIVYTVARGGALAAVWPLSVLWLGETVTAPSAAGAVAVATGLALVGAGRSGRAASRAAGRGVSWAALCALFIAGYSLCYKHALSTGAGATAIFATALGLALPINAARLGRAGTRRLPPAMRASPLALVAAGALCAASFLSFLSALAHGGAGAVTTLRNTSVIFALLLGWALGERPGRPQVAGTACVALGAVLLGWPR